MTPNAAATKLEFSERPFVVIWKTTPATDLVCVQRRAFAPSLRSPLELSTTESRNADWRDRTHAAATWEQQSHSCSSHA
ncbi:MAG: hypothetical protein ACLQOO_22660 [Terriglobia bacterium]